MQSYVTVQFFQRSRVLVLNFCLPVTLEYMSVHFFYGSLNLLTSGALRWSFLLDAAARLSLCLWFLVLRAGALLSVSVGGVAPVVSVVVLMTSVTQRS